MTGALFVAHQNVSDRRLDDRVIHRKNGPTRQTEYDLDPTQFQALDEDLGAGEFHEVALSVY